MRFRQDFPDADSALAAGDFQDVVLGGGDLAGSPLVPSGADRHIKNFQHLTFIKRKASRPAKTTPEAIVDIFRPPVPEDQPVVFLQEGRLGRFPGFGR